MTQPKLDVIIEFARNYAKHEGKLPIILGEEIYEHFGSTCRIVEAAEDGFHLVIRGPFEEVATVELTELRLRDLPHTS